MPIKRHYAKPIDASLKSTIPTSVPIPPPMRTWRESTRHSKPSSILRGGASTSFTSRRWRGEPKRSKQDVRKPVVVKLKARLKGHLTPVYAIAFAPDSGQLITSAFDNEILWWNGDEKPVRRMKLDNGVIPC